MTLIDNVYLLCGNSLEMLRTLEANSVMAVISDPPYGTTELSFDKLAVDWAMFWTEANRVSVENAVFALFSAQPFTTDLINSNRSHFRYDLVWCKTMGTRFLDANKMPLRAHENILIFAPSFHGKGNPKTSTFNPQKTPGKPYQRTRWNETRGNRAAHYNSTADPFKPTLNHSGERYPLDWLIYSNGNNHNEHPSQKPLALMEWLVATYSNPGDLILDPFMGSGTTGVAAVKLGRKFIGIEIDEGYFEIAKRRISEALAQPPLFRLTPLAADAAGPGTAEQMELPAAPLKSNG